MNISNIKSIVLAVALTATPLLASAQGNAPANKPAAPMQAPKTFEAFCDKNTTTISGTFNIYRKASNTYLEISEQMLGKEMLASGVIVKGPWMGTASAITDLITFSKGHGHNLDIRKIKCGDKAEGEMSLAVENSGLQTVMHSYPIVAYAKDKKGYIIDITKDVEATGKLFAFPNLQWVNRPVAGRSGLDSIYNIKDGVKFTCMHTQTDYMPAMSMGAAGYDKHNTVLIDWTLQVMPERKVNMRKADKRVGYTTITLNDYDIDPSRTRSISYIRRWNLQPKAADVSRYNAGQLVEPENPIRVYIDTTFHSSLRSSVVRGVVEWNKCFEKAGFKNAIVVCDGMPESMFAYHQIVLSYALVLGKVQSVSDPRTGEIVCAMGAISDSDLGKRMKDFQLTLGACYPTAFSTDRQAIREELCRFQTAELMGQILGLIPNYGGSMAYSVEQLRNSQWLASHGISASVTDPIAFDYLVQPDDNIPLRNVFSKVGEYDEWAIEWGYRQYPGADADKEKKALADIAMKAKGNAALNFVPASKKGYKASKLDLSSDKLQAAELSMKNLERVLPKLEGYVNSLDDEDAWYLYWEYAPNVYANYSLYVMQAIDYIGSLTREPIIAGYNETPWEIAPKHMQQKAMDFIVRHAYQSKPKWMNLPTLKRIAGYNGDEVMRLLGNNVALRLCNGELMASLMESQLKFGDKAYTLDDMNRVIDHSVFLDFSASKPVNTITTNAQYAFVKQYVEMFKKIRDGKLTDPLSLYMAARIDKVKKAINRLSRSHTDVASRNHYLSLVAYINHRLSAKTQPAAPEAKK